MKKIQDSYIEQQINDLAAAGCRFITFEIVNGQLNFPSGSSGVYSGLAINHAAEDKAENRFKHNLITNISKCLTEFGATNAKIELFPDQLSYR
jgi:hypothetical protein